MAPQSFLRSLFMVKSVTDYQREALNSQLKRTLTAKDVTMIGIGEIIGAGIFVITGKAAALHAGPAIVLSFILSGLACAFAGLCYSEMAALVPVAGSAYTYAYATTGELLAWVIGWDLMLEYLMGAATVAVGWSAYLVSFLNSLGADIGTRWTVGPVEYSDKRGFYSDETTGIINLPAIAIVVLCTTILCLGVRHSAMFNHAMVFVKVIVIMLFLFSTVSYVKPENWSPFIPERTEDGKYGFAGVLRACVSVFFAYIGFDAVSTCAQEVKNPARDMPLGIIGSLVFCTILYILVSLCLTGIKPYTLLGTSAPLADAVKDLGMTWLKIAVSIGGVAGLTSVILVSLLAQPRVFASLAADGLLPPVFGRIHPKFGTPMVSTIVSGTFCVVAAGFLPVRDHRVPSAGTLLAFMLVCISVSVLRFTRPDLERPFRVPLGPIIIPGLGALSAGALIVTTGVETILRLAIWMALGLVVYGGYGYRHSRLRHQRALVPGDEKDSHQIDMSGDMDSKEALHPHSH
ncbi:hypothetical protein H9P43_004179 [Blastocladiella emersonii ATCC 22665]|nr:hypothetical protein H9P43_004179 [Blastocladiella emersonii ATCC 22665]